MDWEKLETELKSRVGWALDRVAITPAPAECAAAIHNVLTDFRKQEEQKQQKSQEAGWPGEGDLLALRIGGRDSKRIVRIFGQHLVLLSREVAGRIGNVFVIGRDRPDALWSLYTRGN